jgi:hypothetical protein
MPSRWTFEIKPIADFVSRHLQGRDVIIDPFSGQSTIGTHRNDLGRGGIDAEPFVRNLIADGVQADAVLFDPPYSPRQISECYKGIGRTVTMKDTQSAVLKRDVRDALSDILKPNGIALSFGWSSTGFGKGWKTLEILLVQHGGGHNDTICVAQTKPNIIQDRVNNYGMVLRKREHT